MKFDFGSGRFRQIVADLNLELVATQPSYALAKHSDLAKPSELAKLGSPWRPLHGAVGGGFMVRINEVGAGMSQQWWMYSTPPYKRSPHKRRILPSDILCRRRPVGVVRESHPIRGRTL
jgi:hypothetical protein